MKPLGITVGCGEGMEHNDKRVMVLLKSDEPLRVAV